MQRTLTNIATFVRVRNILRTFMGEKQYALPVGDQKK